MSVSGVANRPDFGLFINGSGFTTQSIEMSGDSEIHTLLMFLYSLMLTL